jgi:uncharacterized membrane-anchored protein
MRRETAVLAAALGFQALLIAAVPAHEGWIRAVGTTVLLPVQPVDPYDPLRGYSLRFAYRGLDAKLPGFKRDAQNGEQAFAVIRPSARPADIGHPDRLVSSPAEAGGRPVLRVRYDKRGCSGYTPADGVCGRLEAEPDTWYVDERERVRLSRAIRGGLAVAELRVTPDGDASLLRLRPSSAEMGPGG